MALPQINFKEMSESICDGIIRGNSGVMASLAANADSRHRITTSLQINTDKVYALDTEVKLIKGILVMLVGDKNDGSAGLITRMDHDMRELKNDMTTVKGQVKDLTDNLSKISTNIETILDKQAKQSSWTDGWRGVGTAIGIIATCIAIISGVVAGVIWLYQHGVAIGHAGL